MPDVRKLAPAASLGLVLAVGPFLAAAAVATDEVVVKAGDTLSSISWRHGVEIATLVSINGLADANRIFAGQRLAISTTSRPVAPSAGGSPASAPRTHTVARGENLWSIARFYGVSLSELVRVNGVTDAGRIRVGLRLTIPGAQGAPAPPPASVPAPPAAVPAPSPPAAAGAHVVAAGDNLWSIARFYGVSLTALVNANGISDASRIRPGQRVVIPGSRAPAAPATAAPPAPAPAPAPVPAAPVMPARMAEVVTQRAPMRQLITEEATAAGVPVPLALAVAWQESGWRQEVVSSAGAIGVMQLMPGTAQWIGEAMLGRPVNPNDARDNVRAGVRLLAHYLARYGGDRDLTLAAYYQGQGAVDRYGIYPVSRSYIAAINGLVRLFGG